MAAYVLFDAGDMVELGTIWRGRPWRQTVERAAITDTSSGYPLDLERTAREIAASAGRPVVNVLGAAMLAADLARIGQAMREESGTPEHDGHRRRFGLLCDRTHKTPLAAVAASYGLTGPEYALLQMRT